MEMLQQSTEKMENKKAATENTERIPKENDTTFNTCNDNTHASGQHQRRRLGASV